MLRTVRTLLLLLLPTRLSRPIVNRLGYRIARGARVGFSLVMCDRLVMAAGSQIGHFNQIRGPFDIVLGHNAKIGHFNTLSRAAIGITVGGSALSLGEWAAVTARHRLDLTSDICIGNFSTIAGTACQLWTHGYVHDMDGIGRYRIDGPIVIEDNVYIGSMSFISAGVRIAKGVIVGGGSAVAKDLLEPGLYVSGSLRQLPRPPLPQTREDLEPVDPALSCDRVFRKRPRP